MELHEENKFKVRSYTNAAFQISKFPTPIREMTDQQLAEVPGVGKNLVPKILELCQTGHMSYLQEWLDKTPDGVVELLRIKGLGPSKVRVIWTDMGITSPGELLYACNENRLIDFKGFGEKTQQQVKQSIEFMMEHRDAKLYASVEPLIEEVMQRYKEANSDAKIALVGDAARKNNVVSALRFLVEAGTSLPELEVTGMEITSESVDPAQFERQAFLEAAHPDHLVKLNVTEGKDAAEIYQNNDLPVIPIEMREGRDEFQWIKKHDIDQLIEDGRLEGLPSQPQHVQRRNSFAQRHEFVCSVTGVAILWNLRSQ